MSPATAPPGIGSPVPLITANRSAPRRRTLGRCSRDRPPGPQHRRRLPARGQAARRGARRDRAMGNRPTRLATASGSEVVEIDLPSGNDEALARLAAALPQAPRWLIAVPAPFTAFSAFTQFLARLSALSDASAKSEGLHARHRARPKWPADRPRYAMDALLERFPAR
ncbi:MAG: hypothetical protein WDN28_28370 [Chthoniobacter sp.]